MKPQLGQIVIYTVTDADLKQMEDRQKAENNCNVQEKLPAIVVSVFEGDENSTINLKVLMDGVGEMWKTSVQQGDGPGHWKYVNNYPALSE